MARSCTRQQTTIVQQEDKHFSSAYSHDTLQLQRCNDVRMVCWCYVTCPRLVSFASIHHTRFHHLDAPGTSNSSSHSPARQEPRGNANARTCVPSYGVTAAGIIQQQTPHTHTQHHRPHRQKGLRAPTLRKESSYLLSVHLPSKKALHSPFKIL